mgnify:CR=1 FL=1
MDSVRTVVNTVVNWLSPPDKPAGEETPPGAVDSTTPVFGRMRDPSAGPSALKRAAPVEDGTLPEHRFSDLAAPSFYTKPVAVTGEDDLLHMWELPDFGEEGGGGEAALEDDGGEGVVEEDVIEEGRHDKLRGEGRVQEHFQRGHGGDGD